MRVEGGEEVGYGLCPLPFRRSELLLCLLPPPLVPHCVSPSFILPSALVEGGAECFRGEGVEDVDLVEYYGGEGVTGEEVGSVADGGEGSFEFPGGSEEEGRGVELGGVMLFHASYDEDDGGGWLGVEGGEEVGCVT